MFVPPLWSNVPRPLMPIHSLLEVRLLVGIDIENVVVVAPAPVRSTFSCVSVSGVPMS